jgi:Ser-Thr-rich glycosyl-phosphatidyl-inositol-anchored membrane family
MSTTDSTVVDLSNAPFSVVAPVTVLTPNGGELWVKGSTQTITWHAASFVGDVKLALLKGGAGFQAIATVPGASGSFSWTVPTTLPIGSDYTIRVMTATDTTVVDVSDAVFSVTP